MVRPTRVALLFAAVSCVVQVATRADELPKSELPSPPVFDAEREARFAKTLTGATLSGYFTVTTRQSGEQPPKLRTERYDLVEARKVDDRHWLFKARIRYGEHDVTLPMTLPVEWAGDTPVVVVENVGFPGLGTYSARVLFHKDHYAGHWNGPDVGGHLFGTIERRSEAESQATK